MLGVTMVFCKEVFIEAFSIYSNWYICHLSYQHWVGQDNMPQLKHVECLYCT